MYRIGVDIGSTYTKYCVLDKNRHIVEVFSERTPVRQKEYFENKQKELLKKYQGAKIVSCGYGRKNIASVRNINELTALAAGIEYICPGSELVLDIGGQDTKIICQGDGKLKEFFTNDKCAAGCGMFLSNTLHLLGKNFSEIDLRGKKKPDITLSSVCAVFAQSEIVELLATDMSEEIIIQAVVWQILTQAKALLGKAGKSPVVLSGGLTEIPGIGDYAELVFQRKVQIPSMGRYLSAMGCAGVWLEEE